MYRPNYINNLPIQFTDPAVPYSNGLALTQATHQENVATNTHKKYYRLSDTVFTQSFCINNWMRIDHLAGGHIVLLGAMLQSPEIAAGNFDTGILRDVSFNGLVHTNTDSLKDSPAYFCVD